MKLKKIASLMLAGVMAISMLAGCSGNTTDDNKGEGETSTATNYATELRNAMSGAAKRNVTAVADAKLDAALQSAVEKYFTSSDFNGVTTSAVDVNNGEILDSLVEALDAKSGIRANIVDTNTKTTVAVKLYKIDQSVSDAYALELVAGRFAENGDDFFANLSEQSSDKAYDYSYTVSASIVTRTRTIAGLTSGVKYIAVAVTQNVTKVV